MFYACLNSVFYACLDSKRVIIIMPVSIMSELWYSDKSASECDFLRKGLCKQYEKVGYVNRERCGRVNTESGAE